MERLTHLNFPEDRAGGVLPVATFRHAFPQGVSRCCRAMTKTGCVWKIEMLISNRGRVSFKALLDELGVSPVTLKRDRDYPNNQPGAPIVCTRYLNGHKFGEEYRGHRHEPRVLVQRS